MKSKNNMPGRREKLPLINKGAKNLIVVRALVFAPAARQFLRQQLLIQQTKTLFPIRIASRQAG